MGEATDSTTIEVESIHSRIRAVRRAERHHAYCSEMRKRGKVRQNPRITGPDLLVHGELWHHPCEYGYDRGPKASACEHLESFGQRVQFIRIQRMLEF